MRVLIVCSGNTCRSPMAAALLWRLLTDGERLADVTVDSAGTSALDGQQANPEAIAAMAKQNIDLSRHRSKPVTASLVEGVDIVLAMTRDHVDAVLRAAPACKAEVRTLGSYVGVDEDVADPYGRGPKEYERCAHQLESLLRKVADRLTGVRA